jgi:NADH-quinone oxidoreductase subunit M
MAAPRTRLRVLDLDRRELAVVTPLIALIIALGVYPQPLIALIEPAVHATMSDVGAHSTATGGNHR